GRPLQSRRRRHCHTAKWRGKRCCGRSTGERRSRRRSQIVVEVFRDSATTAGNGTRAAEETQRRLKQNRGAPCLAVFARHGIGARTIEKNRRRLSCQIFS